MTLKEKIAPFMQRFHSTGRLDIPQPILDEINAQHKLETGKPIKNCSACWKDYIRQIWNR